MERSCLLPLHRTRSVRLGPRPEAPALEAPLRFAGPGREYRAGVEGCALLDATDRGAVRVSGPDGASFLQRILANEVRGLEVGSGNANLLLSSKGRVVCAFDLLRSAEGLELEATAGEGGRLRDELARYHFGEELAIEERTERTAPLELLGPLARDVLGRTLGELPELAQDDRRELALCTARSGDGAPIRVASAEVAGSAGFRVDGGPELAPRLWEELVRNGAEPVGIEAREALRIEALAPLFGLEVDGGVYPQEAGLEHALDLEKGCYVGQEVVLKIQTYGGLKRRLALLTSALEPPGRGAELRADGEERAVGTLTSSAARAPGSGEGGFVSLALVRLEHLRPGARFRARAREGDEGVETAVAGGPLREGVLRAGTP